jgi:FKBP-type peptidyl-prolyl cis-trans isomerase
MFKYKVFFILLFSVIVASCSKDELSGTEEEQITAYIAKKGFTVTETTASGLRYIRTLANVSGASLKIGQTISVKYTGKLLTDKQFDSGSFAFVLGGGGVIKGFDEGIAKMKIGEKATLIFPSSLGYGSSGIGSDIPGYAPLLFDIEVVSAR